VKFDRLVKIGECHFLEEGRRLLNRVQTLVVDLLEGLCVLLAVFGHGFYSSGAGGALPLPPLYR
jgi:hypothetical protein